MVNYNDSPAIIQAHILGGWWSGEIILLCPKMFTVYCMYICLCTYVDSFIFVFILYVQYICTHVGHHLPATQMQGLKMYKKKTWSRAQILPIHLPNQPKTIDATLAQKVPPMSSEPQALEICQKFHSSSNPQGFRIPNRGLNQNLYRVHT